MSLTKVVLEHMKKIEGKPPGRGGKEKRERIIVTSPPMENSQIRIVKGNYKRENNNQGVAEVWDLGERGPFRLLKHVWYVLWEKWAKPFVLNLCYLSLFVIN